MLLSTFVFIKLHCKQFRVFLEKIETECIESLDKRKFGYNSKIGTCHKWANKTVNNNSEPGINISRKYRYLHFYPRMYQPLILQTPRSANGRESRQLWRNNAHIFCVPQIQSFLRPFHRIAPYFLKSETQSRHYHLLHR